MYKSTLNFGHAKRPYVIGQLGRGSPPGRGPPILEDLPLSCDLQSVCRNHLRGSLIYSEARQADFRRSAGNLFEFLRCAVSAGMIIRRRSATGGFPGRPARVPTQFTGPPEFDTAEAFWAARHADRGPGVEAGGRTDDVVVVRVVCAISSALEIFGAVVVTGVAAGGRRLSRTGAVVVTTGLGVTTGGGAAGGGGGATSAGGAVVIAGAGVVGSVVVVSTLAGASSARDAERSALTPGTRPAARPR